jgi:hypothetical protein
MVQLHAVADSGIPSNRHSTAPQWQEPWIISASVAIVAPRSASAF